VRRTGKKNPDREQGKRGDNVKKNKSKKPRDNSNEIIVGWEVTL